MSTMMNVTRTRLQRLLDERVALNNLHEDLQASAEAADGHDLSDAQKSQLQGYRIRMEEIDTEVGELNETLEREADSIAASKRARAHLAGEAPGVSIEEGETHYRTFAAYARDELLVRFPKLGAYAGGEKSIQQAKERLQRVPANTITSGLAGLNPPQFIAQIMDVINSTRPVIASARKVTLDKGVLNYPLISQRPVALLQPSEKSEGGTQAMQVTMGSGTAQTYLAGGDLSWQAINWSTPDALDLWFQLAAESYAQKTETYVAGFLGSAATGTVSTPGAIGSDFPTWMSAIVRGIGTVYAASKAFSDTLYLAPDMFFSLASLTSSAGAQFINQGQINLAGMSGSVGGLRVVTSYGFSAGKAYVGDSRALIVGETANSPVELRAVEPSIGGMEVGIIGAVAAGVIAGNRFARVST